MGQEQFPANAEAGAEYRLLIMPTFHPPGCLRIALADESGELSLSWLPKHTFEVFEAVWRKDGEAEVLAVQRARQACLEDCYGLPVQLAAVLRQELAALELPTWEDFDQAARDGIRLRCDCREHGQQHAIAFGNPTAQDAPRHHALAALLLDAALACAVEPETQSYLTSARSYLH